MSEERTNMAIRDLKHYVIDNMSLDVQDDFEIICKYITNLQQKVEQLEKENKKLIVKCDIGNDNLTFYKKQWKQLENIRKEAIEYIKNTDFDSEDNIVAKKVKDGIIGAFILENKIPNDLLNILNKGSDKE